ncbi:hypothetical protein HPULCUR_009581 [Helicostylum pulchrum]|uniref:Anaphase-promoting complex subunit 4 n=1 Tax=Helicostylum pulchrum TaxID=562976 RepID=A0ABP9YBW7_9FUNG
MSEPFELFNEKLLADNIQIISWCPTADLVLLVSHENTISLYRKGIEVTKLWSLKNAAWSEIKIVTWKPNGKELVIGCVNGNVYRIDITYHTPKMYPCWSPVEEPASITSLVWINYEYKKGQTDIEGFDMDAFDIESSLPTLSDEPPEEPSSRLPISKRKKVQLPRKPLYSTETQTLLFIGNVKGLIHITLNGVYPIGLLDMFEEKLNPILLNISVPHAVSSVQVLAKSTDENGDKFILNVIDTSILQDKKEQIFSISEIQTKLDYLLEYTSSTLNVLVRHHTAYSLLTSKIATVASEYILKNDDQTTAMPEVELTGTLAIGSVTETLRLFFEEYLTSQYIKQLESNVTHGYQNSLKIACEHIIPACERIQLELSKLLGFSLWTQRYGDFLETTAVEKTIHHIRQFVSHIHLFTKDLNHLSNTFQAFIKWITTVTEKVAVTSSAEFQNESSLCEDPELVLEFLNKDLIKDSLDYNSKQLVHLLANIKTSCRQMLEKPSVTFNEQMKDYRDGIQYNYHAFLQLNPDPKLVILKNGFGKGSKVQCAIFNIPEGIITDMEFFDDKELGICIQKDKDHSLLFTVLLCDVEFKGLPSTKLFVAAKSLEVSRSLELEKMNHVKIGCNGQPKRRIMCLVASNGLLKIYSMENEEAEDSDCIEDDDQSD